MSSRTTDYQKFSTKDMSVEDRRKLDIGDIRANTAKCLLCKQKIRSTNRHDFRRCKCGNLAVDGGSWYAKRVYNQKIFGKESYKDMVEMYDILQPKKVENE